MGDIKILLASTDQRLAKVRDTLQSRRGFRLLYSASAIETFNQVKFEHPDIVLLDFELPDMSGDEVCRGLKADPQTRGTVIAMLVAEGDEWFKQRAEAAGADTVLPKPVPPPVLENWIAGVIHAPIRKAIRVPIRIKVDGATSAGELRGESVDISTTGMRMFMAQCDLEAGFSLWLKFQLEASLPAIVCKAEVMRVAHSDKGYHVGLKFTSFNGEGGPILRKFLRAHGA